MSARRRAATLAGGTLAALIFPLVLFQFLGYRADLAVARQTFPALPPLGPSDRVLVVAPHCDDETLGAGGLLAQAIKLGATCHVAFLTNGDGSRSTQLAVGAMRWQRTQYPALARLRQGEARAAMARVGVPARDLTFLGYPDGGCKDLWERHWSGRTLYRSPFTGAERAPYANAYTPAAPYCGQQVVRDLERLLVEFEPTIILTTHPNDTHGDHWAAYAFTAAALERLRLLPTSAPWAERTQLLGFLIHHGLWPVPHGYRPQAPLAPPAVLRHAHTLWLQAPLSPDELEQKTAALMEYRSQLPFTPHYLRSFLRRNELFGMVETPASADRGMVPVIADPLRDSLLHDLWPAADVHRVDAERLYTGTSLVSLTIHTGSRAARRLSYRLALHAVTAHGVQAAVLTVRADRTAPGGWRGRLQTTAGYQDVLVENRRGALRVQLATASLGLGTEKAALLISTSVSLQGRHLDQTQTGILRWNYTRLAHAS